MDTESLTLLPCTEVALDFLIETVDADTLVTTAVGSEGASITLSPPELKSPFVAIDKVFMMLSL